MARKAIKSTIKILAEGSRTLNKAYEEAIERIGGQLSEEAELAKRVISWITYAEWRLTTKELSHAHCRRVKSARTGRGPYPRR